MVFFITLYFFPYTKTQNFTKKINILITPPDKKDPTFMPVCIFSEHNPIKDRVICCFTPWHNYRIEKTRLKKNKIVKKIYQNNEYGISC